MIYSETLVELEEILRQAESTAKRASVVGWYFVGFFLGLIGLLIVYLVLGRK